MNSNFYRLCLRTCIEEPWNKTPLEQEDILSRFGYYSHSSAYIQPYARYPLIPGAFILSPPLWCILACPLRASCLIYRCTDAAGGSLQYRPTPSESTGIVEHAFDIGLPPPIHPSEITPRFLSIIPCRKTL